ncbi:unnamed protein product, partial [Trichobilharzia regenti]
MDRLIHVLSDTVLRAKITDSEVEMAARSISFELEAMERSPPVEPMLNELLHTTAPERMVIAGVGIEHDALVKSVEKYFIPTVPNVSNERVAKNLPPPDNSVSQYTGGYQKVERDLSQYHAPMPEFAHAAIGFESCSYTEEQFVPACLLHSLLG